MGADIGGMVVDWGRRRAEKPAYRGDAKVARWLLGNYLGNLT